MANECQGHPSAVKLTFQSSSGTHDAGGSSRSARHAASALETRITRRTRGVEGLRPRGEAPIPVAARYSDTVRVYASRQTW